MRAKTAVTSLLVLTVLASGTPEQATALADPRVGSLLDVLNLTHYAAHFASHEVDYETLLGLTDADLKEVGVKAVGARRRILKKAGENRVTADCGCNSGGWKSGHCFELPVKPVDHSSGSHTYGQVAQTVDVNGDGLMDWVYAITELDQSTCVKCMFINTGCGWIESLTYTEAAATAMCEQPGFCK